MSKVLLSIDDASLKQIDSMAKARGLSRSRYLTQLAQREAERTSRQSLASLRRTLDELDHLLGGSPPGDSTAAIRAERDAR